MLKIRLSTCVQSDAKAVWGILADLESIQFWSADVQSARSGANACHGLGAERICTLSNGLEIEEAFIEWSEGQRYTYRGRGLPGAATLQNTWAVESVGDTCLLSSESLVVMKYGILGWALERMLYPLAVYKGRQALRSIAFMAENGRPADLKVDRLPRFVSAC